MLGRPRSHTYSSLVLTVGAKEAASTPQGDADHDHGGQELDGGDVHPVEAQQALECGGDAHGLVTSWFSASDTANLGPAPCATRTLRNASSASPHKPYAAKPIHIWVRRAGNWT
jgi:hypothetical protein